VELARQRFLDDLLRERNSFVARHQRHFLQSLEEARMARGAGRGFYPAEGDSATIVNREPA
jgi:hypothetical protein